MAAGIKLDSPSQLLRSLGESSFLEQITISLFS